MNQEEIGRYILQKRKEKNLTQSQLAELIGVSNKSVSKWENGKCMPDYGVIIPLCNALDITVAELIDGKDDKDKTDRMYDDSQVMDLLKRMQELEVQVKKISGIVILKTVRIVALIMLIISVFVAVDLGINMLWSLISEVNDGLGVYSKFHYLYFGDDGWSRKMYMQAFERSLWGMFVLLVVNVSLKFGKKNSADRL